MSIIKPNNNTISAITALPAAITTGKILQVVNATTTSQTTSSSSSFEDTALSASITPSSTSNKVLAMTFSNVEIGGSASGYLTLDRGGTNLGSGSNGFGVIQDNNGAKNSAFHFLDSPSSTSALTYKVQIRTNNTSVSVYHNPNGAKAAITLMEIEG